VPVGDPSRPSRRAAALYVRLLPTATASGTSRRCFRARRPVASQLMAWGSSSWPGPRAAAMGSASFPLAVDEGPPTIPVDPLPTPGALGVLWCQATLLGNPDGRPW